MHLRSPRSLPSRPHKLTGGQAKELFLPGSVIEISLHMLDMFFLLGRLLARESPFLS